MAPPIESLPPEMLQQSIRRLAPSDLKALRLSCKLLSNNAVPFLPWKIYFAPRKEVMQDFQAMVDHSTISGHVKELVFDARLIRHPVDDDDCIAGVTGCCKRGGRLPHPSWTEIPDGKMEIDAFPTSHIPHPSYEASYAEQEAIFLSGQDIQILSNGSRRLPKLSIISVLDHFESEPPGGEGLHSQETYSQEKQKWYIERTLAQSADSIFDTTANQANRRWSFQGVKNLYCALTLAAVKVSAINIGLPGCLPLDMLTVAWPTIACPFHPTFAGGLTRLRLSLCPIYDIPNDIMMWVPHVTALFRFRQFLRSLPMLETLEIGSTGRPCSRGLLGAFLDVQWPRLKNLHLQEMLVISKELEILLLNHKKSLLTLSLRFIYENDSRAWTERMGKELKLDILSLSNIGDEFACEAVQEDPPYLGIKDLRKLAADIMHREPFGIEVVGEECGTTVVATATRVQSGGKSTPSCGKCGQDNHPGFCCNGHSELPTT